MIRSFMFDSYMLAQNSDSIGRRHVLSIHTCESYEWTAIALTEICSNYSSLVRACLHGGGGPQEGEVNRFGGVTCLST